MTLHYLFGVLLTLVCSASCAQSNASKTKGLPQGQKINDDTSSVVVIQFDQKMSWPFPKDYTPTSLAHQEIDTLDSLIKDYTSIYTDSLKGNLREAFGVDFKKFKYKRQYVPVINQKGEIEVWANFFCAVDGEQWRTEINFAQDGGNCFFSLKVNLSTKTCYDLIVNGYA